MYYFFVKTKCFYFGIHLFTSLTETKFMENIVTFRHYSTKNRHILKLYIGHFYRMFAGKYCPFPDTQLVQTHFEKIQTHFDQVKSILQENIVTFKTNLNSDNFQTHSTKIQTHTDIFQTHFDKNSDILQDGVKLFLIRLFLSQNVSEFWPKVSEFVWKELPQKGKKSFWVYRT